jgi:hypothetical protein
VSAQLASSPPFFLPGVASPLAHTIASCHASFPLSQDELTVCDLSFGNVWSRHLLYQVETEVLNPHCCHRLPISDRPTHTLHRYKNVISTLVIFSITPSRLYFFFLLVSASHHRSSTHCHYSLSLPSYVHRHSPQ